MDKKNCQCEDGDIRGRQKHVNNDNRRKRTVTASSSTQPPAPDGGWGYAVVIGVWIGLFAIGGINRATTLIYQELFEKFARSATETAWVFSLSGVFRFLMSPAVSVICNRFGVRAAVIFGTVLSAGGLVACAWPLSLFYMYVTFGVLFGVGSSFVVTSCFIIVSQYFDKKRGKANAIATMGGGIGGIVIAPIVVVLFKTYGYSGTMLIMGALLLHFFVSAALFRPVSQCKIQTSGMSSLEINHLSQEEECHNSRKRSPSILETTEPLDLGSSLSISRIEDDVELKEIKNTDSENQVSNSKRRKNFLSKYINLELLREKQFLSFSFMMMGVFVSFSAANTFMVGLAKERNISSEEFAVILVVASGIDLGGRFASGFLFDLKIVKHHRVLLFVLLGLIFSVFICILPLTTNFQSFITVCSLRVMFSSAFHAQHFTILSDLVGKGRISSAIGLSRTLMGLGYLIGPTVGGLLRDVYGEYCYTYYFCGSVTGFSVLTLMVLNFKEIIYGHKILNKTKTKDPS